MVELTNNVQIGYIYCTTDKTNGKKYVGQHKSPLFDRKYYGSGKIIKDILKKYKAEERFDIEILEWCNSAEMLDLSEKYFISTLNTMYPLGYNYTSGGQQSKCYSEETKRKISEAVSGENHPLYGKNHPLEVIEKIRKSNLGKKKIRSVEGNIRYWESRERQKITFKTPEFREKISKATKGKNNPRYIEIPKEEFLEAFETMKLNEVMEKFSIGKGTVYNKLKEFKYGKYD